MATSIVEGRREHARFLAWVILAASRSHLERGLWDFFVDGDEARCLRFIEALTTTDGTIRPTAAGSAARRRPTSE